MVDQQAQSPVRRYREDLAQLIVKSTAVWSGQMGKVVVTRNEWRTCNGQMRNATGLNQHNDCWAESLFNGVVVSW
jgi:hypothetical protein